MHLCAAHAQGISNYYHTYCTIPLPFFIISYLNNKTLFVHTGADYSDSDCTQQLGTAGGTLPLFKCAVVPGSDAGASWRGSTFMMQ